MDHKESFLQYLQTEKRYSPLTVRSYLNDLDQFEKYLNTQELPGNPDGITSHDVRSWIVSLLENGYSSVSVHRKVSCLRVFYRYLRKEGFTKTDPVEKVVLPKMKKRLPVFVDETSLNRLLDDHDFGGDFKGVRNRLIVEMLYLTGMRRAELTGLHDIDVDTEGAAVKVTGKRNKQRIIPLLKPFTIRIEEYLKTRNETFPNNEQKWFFVSNKGNKLYDKYVYNIVRKLI